MPHKYRPTHMLCVGCAVIGLNMCCNRPHVLVIIITRIGLTIHHTAPVDDKISSVTVSILNMHLSYL